MIDYDDFIELLPVVGNQQAKITLLDSYVAAAGPIPERYKERLREIINEDIDYKTKHGEYLDASP